MRRRLAVALALVVPAALLSACSEDPPADPDRTVLTPSDVPAHSHNTTVGDGTTASAGGYTLTDLRVPTKTRTPQDIGFVIRDADGKPVTDFREEQTKLLHAYVVRADLGDYRHFHPELGDDGRWTGRVDLLGPGRYRVIAEFAPTDEPNGAHVVLGRWFTVKGRWMPALPDPETSGTDGIVTVEAPPTMAAGPDQQMTLRVSDGDGGVLNLGTYLGSYAHVTGFDIDTGQFVHTHPLGAPTPTDDGSTLLFHTSFPRPGRYQFFVETRVDGFVHTVVVGSEVVE